MSSESSQFGEAKRIDAKHIRQFSGVLSRLSLVNGGSRHEGHLEVELNLRGSGLVLKFSGMRYKYIQYIIYI